MSRLFCRALCLSLLLTLAPLTSSASSPVIDATIYTQHGELPLKLEIAVTAKTREHGLMARDTLKPNDGMLFVFPASEAYTFWMKNTRIPLDMLFIDDSNTIICIEQSAKPYTLNPRGPREPSIAVIELDGGRSVADGIAVGDKVRYVLPKGTQVE